MHYLLFLFISVSSSSLLALDSFTLSGSVSSRSGDPLIGANVNVIGTVFGTATDGRGGYVFEVLRKSFSQDTMFVKASYIGYQSQLDTILIKDIENAPSAKKIMSEKNLDPKKIIGSGRDGRIMKEDVQTLSPMIKVAKGIENNSNNSQIENEDGHEERVKMSRLRQTISSRLKEAQNTAAILTTYNEVDMSEIKKIRTDYKDLFIQKHGISLGFMSFFVKACVIGLKNFPAVNAEIQGDEIVYKNYYNISIAVGTDRGLVVPVLRETDEMSFADIEKYM